MGSSFMIGQNKETMLEQEMKAIRRLKDKQKREVQAMVDYEVKMSAIREKNEMQMKSQQDQDYQHQKELAYKRQEYE